MCVACDCWQPASRQRSLSMRRVAAAGFCYHGGRGKAIRLHAAYKGALRSNALCWSCVPAVKEGQRLAVAQVWQCAISSALLDGGVVQQLPIVEESGWKDANGWVHSVLLRQHRHRHASLPQAIPLIYWLTCRTHQGVQQDAKHGRWTAAMQPCPHTLSGAIDVHAFVRQRRAGMLKSMLQARQSASGNKPVRAVQASKHILLS